MNSTINILNALNGMKPPSPSLSKTPFEKFADRFSWWAIRIWFGIAAVLVALAITNHYMVLPNFFVGAAYGLMIAAIVLGILVMLVTTSASALSLITMNRFVHRSFLAQVKSDAENAAILNRYPLKDLQSAKACLELRINRTRNRVGWFAGAPDKLGIPAVVAMGWATYTALAGKFEGILSKPFTEIDLIDLVLALTIASVVGMVLGALSLYIHMQKHVYQLELLNVALATRDEPEAGQ